ncbi:hypothetical protein BDY24DRAFT_379373 [Mrakia frigida]|uniref:copper acquisition factor BIM1-like domain-containing protein n=1 Tax=Mrakia frigida TaxID=29902 RepID=UPI003FCBEF3B
MVSASSLFALLAVGASSVQALVLPRAELIAAPLAFLFPTSRGNTAATQAIGPCQGFSSTGRTSFPITGGKLSFTAIAKAREIQISYASSPNATLEQFQDLLPEAPRIYAGSKCYPTPDFSTLGFSVGDNVTIGVELLVGATNATGYECSDITLVAAADFVESALCQNITTSSVTNITVSNNVTLADDGGVSRVAAGGIGASVGIVFSLAVFALLFGLMYRKGYAFKRDNTVHQFHSDQKMKEASL